MNGEKEVILTRTVNILSNLNRDFSEVLEKKYYADCNRYNVEPSYIGFVKFLLERNIIKEKTVTEYMTFEYYPELLYKNDNTKQRAIWDLEDKVPLKERSIWGLIKRGRNSIFAKKNIPFAKNCDTK